MVVSGESGWMMRRPEYAVAGPAMSWPIWPALVYAGYSAGACVLSPSLRGLEAVDDAGAVTRVYGAEPVRDGLGLLDEAFVPHYRSPGHPETAAIELVVARYAADGIATAPCATGRSCSSTGPQPYWRSRGHIWPQGCRGPVHR
jgi:hypothetical protein